MTYRKAWSRFCSFVHLHNENQQLPIPSHQIVNYLADLFDGGYAPSTIATHASAICFVHKLLGFQDPMESFLLKKFVKGAINLSRAADSRLPITKSILQRLLRAIPTVIRNYNEQVLLKALFTLVYSFFLRFGEVVLKSGNDSNKLVQIENISIQTLGSSLKGMSLVLHHFKHKQQVQPVSLYIAHNPQNVECCPVESMQKYLRVLGNKSGPLFQFLDGKVVSYNYTADKLRTLVRFIGLDTQRYKPHSFRIGAATTAIQMGYSDDEVKKMGRWSSDALQSYIRLPQIHL